jgi:hypothetical protein
MKKRQHTRVEREDDLWDTEQSRIADLLSESEDRLRQFLDRLHAERTTVLRRPSKRSQRRPPPTCE